MDFLLKILSRIKNVNTYINIIILFTIILQITLSSDNSHIPTANNYFIAVFKEQNNFLFFNSLLTNVFIIFLGLLISYWLMYFSHCVARDPEGTFLDVKLGLAKNNTFIIVKIIAALSFSLKYLFTVICCFWLNYNFPYAIITGVNDVSITIFLVLIYFSFCFYIISFLRFIINKIINK